MFQAVLLFCTIVGHADLVILLRHPLGSWGSRRLHKYETSRDRLGSELRRSFGLWRDSQYAQFQLAQLQQAEL
jgi:hypothetical protein